MMEIKRANQSHTYRMLQCLTVAIRPLSVAELAELLAFDFDKTKGGIPKLNSDWRWADHEQAVLSTCSSLVTVVPNDGSPVVQFSHFSVKEFLMSDRLATSRGDISQYHISPEDANTLLAQASLAVLLRDPDVNNHADNGPLAGYAAEHWVTHAQVKNVAPRLRDGMKDLFDPIKPYFEAWVRLHDIDPDIYPSRTPDSEPGARPLYYAALCGFHELMEHLILKYPQCANARGGNCGTALHSASHAGHLQIVRSLLKHGVGVDVRDHCDRTPLLFASREGHCDIIHYLLEHGANVAAQDDDHNPPLAWAAFHGHVNSLQVLLEHGADVHSQNSDGRTPLHSLIWGGDCFKGDRPKMARLLLKHGANVNARNKEHQTVLHLAVSECPDLLDVLRILLEHGADVDAEDENGHTPLQMSLERGHEEVTQLLSGHSRRE
jgi:ankyrin repeat protein